jgi:hypothetical protein
VHNAFVGHQICDVRPGRAAVNILGFGRTFGNGIDVRDWAHNSFHPNALGHQLLANHVESTLRAWSEDKLSPLDPAPNPGDLPPPPDEAIGVPNGPYPFPSGTKCTGKDIATKVPVRVGADAPARVPIRLDDVAPASTICFREYKDRWRSTRAPSQGAATIQARVDRPGIASENEIIYRTIEGNWVWVVVRRLSIDAPA